MHPEVIQVLLVYTFYSHRYCQTLPKDRYTIPAPDFRTEKIAISGHNCHSHRVSDQEYEYQTILTFPMSAPIKEHIEVTIREIGWEMW